MQAATIQKAFVARPVAGRAARSALVRYKGGQGLQARPSGRGGRASRDKGRRLAPQGSALPSRAMHRVRSALRTFLWPSALPRAQLLSRHPRLPAC